MQRRLFRTNVYIGMTIIAQGNLRVEGVGSDETDVVTQRLLINKAPNGAAYLRVDVVETDGWPNNDDDFDLIQYLPNPILFSRIPLNGPTDKNVWFPLKEQPYIAFDDPEKVRAFHLD